MKEVNQLDLLITSHEDFFVYYLYYLKVVERPFTKKYKNKV